LVPTVLGVLALVSSDADLRRAAVGAAVAYSLLIALAAIYPASHDVAPRYFVGMLAGHLVVAIAVMIDLVNRSRRPDTDSPDRNRSASG
jgi:hypothetical protein